MKKILVILLTSIVLFSCENKNLYIVEEHVDLIIDSVEYHAIGTDNTLQTTPYWKVHFKGEEIPIRVYRKPTVGDTISVVKKIVKKIEDKHGN